MILNPHIEERILLMILVVSIAAVVLMYFRSKRFSKNKRIIIALLRLTVLFSLIIIMLNPVKELEVIGKATLGKNIVLLDQSTSMNVGSPVTRWNQLMQDVLPIMNKQFEIPVDWILFDSLSISADSIDLKNQKQVNGSSTYLIKAIEDAIHNNSNGDINNVIVCSDGQSVDKKRVKSAISAAINSGASISVMGYGEETVDRNASIVNVDIASDLRPNTKLTIYPVLNFSGISNEPYHLQLFKDNELIDEKKGIVTNDNMHLSMNLTTGVRTSDYSLQLKSFEGEQTEIDNICDFKINVFSPKIRVLYMEGSINSSPRPGGGYWLPYRYIEDACLKTGDIEIDCYQVNFQDLVGGEIFHTKSQKQGYPKTKEELNKYDVVICSDINHSIFSEKQLEWTRDLVAINGGGFCMIGGNTAFGAGGWDKTILEKVIPVDMQGYGSTRWNTVYPSIPEESLLHPIWQLGKDPKESKDIVKTHPAFHGTNMVNRAKPGATVLAYWAGENNMPIICVQSYGKGRSMAFTSDAAGDWGIGYQDAWGPMGSGNAYYQKFWTNAIMWLAENSLNLKKNKFKVYCDRLNYFTNSVVEFTVELNDVNRDYTVEARSLGDNTNVISLKSVGGGKYKGTWEIPYNYSKSNALFVLNAHNKETARTLKDSLWINIILANNEFLNSNPDFELLEYVMTMTGGKNLKSAHELKELLKNNSEELKGEKKKSTIPLWDKWYVWLFIVGLWTMEWLIRKKG